MTDLEARLIAALHAINDRIFAVGAPLGSEAYFDIRKLCCDAITEAGAWPEVLPPLDSK